MDCPRCTKTCLEPRELDDGLIVAGCPRCRGSLLSLLNYRYWRDRHDGDEGVAAEPVAKLAEDSQSALMCPKCQRMMMKYQVAADESRRLDMCISCEEAWFDEGEWHLLKQLDLQDQLPAIFTDRWQRNIRERRATLRKEERMRDVIGAEDFDKVLEFKKWLVEHSKEGDIRRFLSSK